MSSQAKPFSWSYSHIKNVETCPKRYYHTTVAAKGSADRIEEKYSEKVEWGNVVHLAHANYFIVNTPFPIGMKHYEPVAQKFKAAKGETLIEQRLAINEALQPTDWFATDAWCRAIIDFGKSLPPKALLIDWKTGKRKQDDLQLKIIGLVFFAHEPAVDLIESAFVWLNDGFQTDRISMHRDDIKDEWAEIMPRVNALKKMRETNDFPPKPSGLCRRYCPVTTCPYHGT